MLGLNTHLEESIGKGVLDVSKFWVAEYLKASPKEIEDDGARVTAFLRVSQRTETIDQQFIDDNMTRYQLSSGGRATHLIDQVEFGVEFIFAMRRVVDLKTDTKKSAESRMFVESRIFFDQIISSNWTDLKLPTELENVSCTLYSNFDQLKKNFSIQQSVEWIVNSMKNDRWRPVSVRLRLIPAQIGFRLQMEKIVTKKREMELHLFRISANSRILSKNPCLQKIPPLRNAFAQFQELLAPIHSKLEEFHTFHLANLTVPKQVIGHQEDIIQLLSNAKKWLLSLRQQVETLHPILNDVDLAVLDMDEINSRPLSNCEHRIKVFVFKVNYEEDEMLKCLYKLLGHPSRDVKLPVFSIVSAEKERILAIGDNLTRFSRAACLSTDSDCSYQIGLLSSPSSLVDGSIIAVVRPAKEKAIAKPIPSMPPPLMPIFPTTDDDKMFAINSAAGRVDSQLSQHDLSGVPGPSQKD